MKKIGIYDFSTKPVILLTSAYTFSSLTGFAAAVQDIGR